MTEQASIQIPRLCEQCAASATRASVTLCGTCAQSFRVVYLPDDVRTWDEIARDAHGDNGAEIEELIKGLQVRIFNQQRELSKLNRSLRESALKAGRLDGVLERLRSAIGQKDEASALQAALDPLDLATRYIRRYAWIRDGNGYALEEAFARGEEAVDRVCDEGIREAHGVTA